PSSIVLGDLDGDGKLDIVTANFDRSTVAVLRNTTAEGDVSAISFASPVEFAVGNNPVDVVVCDFNWDAKPEIGAACFGNNTLTILRNALPTVPRFTLQPKGQSVPPGTNVLFSATAVASGASVSYQWQLNHTNLPGATGPTLLLTNV